MKIYFSQPDPQYDHDTEDMFINENNELFYFHLEYGTNAGGTEEFMLRDTCGREVPVRVDNISDLIRALQEIQNLAAELDVMHATQNLIFSKFTASVKNGKTYYSDKSIRNAIE